MIEQLIGGMNEVKGGMKELKNEVGRVQGDMSRMQGELTLLYGEVATLKQESECSEPSSRNRRRREILINRGIGHEEDYLSDEHPWGVPQNFLPHRFGHRNGNNHREDMMDYYHRQPRDRPVEDDYGDPLKGTKHSLSEFHGKFDPEAYLGWE